MRVCRINSATECNVMCHAVCEVLQAKNEDGVRVYPNVGCFPALLYPPLRSG